MNDGGSSLPLKRWWREPLNIHRLETMRRREEERERAPMCGVNAPHSAPLVFLTPPISSFSSTRQFISEIKRPGVNPGAPSGFFLFYFVVVVAFVAFVLILLSIYARGVNERETCSQPDPDSFHSLSRGVWAKRSVQRQMRQEDVCLNNTPPPPPPPLHL